MPRGGWTMAVLLVAFGGIAPAAAQRLAAVGPPPDSRPAALLGPPVAVVGEPIQPQANPAPVTGSPVPPPAAMPTTPKSKRTARLGIPTTDSNSPPTLVFVPQQATATAPAAANPVNDLFRLSSYKDGFSTDINRPSPKRESGKLTDDIGDRVGGIFGEPGQRFRSDHAFDGFISPVTNPFLFEDPRSLTEVRPIFLIEHIPSSQPDFRGGNVTFFGLQARVAITERLSFVINKLGGIAVTPAGESEFDSHVGLAEIWLGPKYTFIRNEQTGTLMAGGLQFQIPVGNGGTFQDTGTLSMVPYVSYAQSFLRDLSIGGFNGMATTGYSFSVNNERSDYFYLSGHVDWDVMNCHRFYPLVEMNYFVYTTNGQTTPIGIEGQDLINFGGHAQGQGLLTFAFGSRFKITESAQIGAAFEVPLAGPRGLMDYRFTLDFILRY